MATFKQFGGLDYYEKNNIVTTHNTHTTTHSVSGHSGETNTRSVHKSHVDLSGNSLLRVDRIYFTDGSIQSSAGGGSGGGAGPVGPPGPPGKDGSSTYVASIAPIFLFFIDLSINASFKTYLFIEKYQFLNLSTKYFLSKFLSLYSVFPNLIKPYCGKL